MTAVHAVVLAIGPPQLWTGLLAVGIIVTFVSTVALIVGLSPARRATPVRSAEPPRTVEPLQLRSASGVRDQAAARARKAAEAAAPPPPAPPAASRRHVLTEVHVLRPAGQSAVGGDDLGEERFVTDQEANAIVAHFAENDPARIAEVITQWIRSDEKQRFDDHR